jgi:hypothetical protein
MVNHSRQERIILRYFLVTEDEFPGATRDIKNILSFLDGPSSHGRRENLESQ